MKTKSSVPDTVPESVYTARLTLKEWLKALEAVHVLKAGATTRILANPRLQRMSMPAVSATVSAT